MLRKISLQVNKLGSETIYMCRTLFLLFKDPVLAAGNWRLEQVIIHFNITGQSASLHKSVITIREFEFLNTKKLYS